MMNVAKALVGDRDIEISITGIRPGEKLHEIMVSEEEMHHCVDREPYYAIKPMLPELQVDSNEQNVLDKEFSSEDNLLDEKGTLDLLRKHDLLLEQVQQNEEILR